MSGIHGKSNLLVCAFRVLVHKVVPKKLAVVKQALAAAGDKIVYDQ